MPQYLSHHVSNATVDVDHLAVVRGARSVSLLPTSNSQPSTQFSNACLPDDLIHLLGVGMFLLTESFLDHIEIEIVVV